MTLNLHVQQANYKQVSSKEFKKLIENKNGILMDVRTLNEFKNGHLKEAGQLNYYSLSFKRKLLLLPKNQPIYIYCNTGFRSERAARILIKNGYPEVYNLAQGIMEWNLNNLPVVVDPDAEPDKDNFMNSDQYANMIAGDSLVLIDFYAPWCAPCRTMMPMIDSLKTTYHQDVKIVKINVDASKRLIKELKLLSIPFFVMYRKGELLFSHNGVISKGDLMKQLDKNLK